MRAGRSGERWRAGAPRGGTEEMSEEWRTVRASNTTTRWRAEAHGGVQRERRGGTREKAEESTDDQVLMNMSLEILTLGHSSADAF